MAGLFYDYDGEPISLDEWAALSEGRSDLTRWLVGRDRVGDYEISTVWLGLDHNYFGGPPLIFETMIFRVAVAADGPDFAEDVDWELDEQWRYATAEQAEAGHREVVEECRRRWNALEEAREQLTEGTTDERRTRTSGGDAESQT